MEAGWRRCSSRRNGSRSGAWLALAVGASALVPFLSDSDYVIRVAVNTVLFALLALGLNVVVGWAGLLDLGFVAFYGFGAYLYAILSSTSSTCICRPCSRSRS